MRPRELKRKTLSNDHRILGLRDGRSAPISGGAKGLSHTTAEVPEVPNAWPNRVGEAAEADGEYSSGFPAPWLELFGALPTPHFARQMCCKHARDSGDVTRPEREQTLESTVARTGECNICANGDDDT